MRALASTFFLTHNKPCKSLAVTSHDSRSAITTHVHTISLIYQSTDWRPWLLHFSTLQAFRRTLRPIMKGNPYEYTTYTKRDLQRMLSGRDLATTGNKAELVARLTEYDSHQWVLSQSMNLLPNMTIRWHSLYSPFPFLKLPGEVRNEIYRYVAVASNNAPKTRPTVPGSYFEYQSSNIDMGNKHNSASITAPGLFYICSQVYHESRVFFYRYHDFRLYIWQDHKAFMYHLKASVDFKRHNKCMERMFSWLDAIGPDMRKAIRNLDIELQCHESLDVTPYSDFIDDLHGSLSDDTTVTYRPIATNLKNGLNVLWKLAKVFYKRDPGRVPRLEYPAWARPPISTQRDEDDIWNWINSPFYGNPLRRRNAGVSSLTFESGARWFGGEWEGIDM